MKRALLLCSVAALLIATQAQAQQSPFGSGVNPSTTPGFPGGTQTPAPNTSPAAASDVVVVLTRPANTTTYTANTAFANASGNTYATLTSVCKVNGGRVILDVRVQDYANQTTKMTGELWFFQNPPTTIADDATFNLASTDVDGLAGLPLTFSPTSIANQNSGASGFTVAQAVPSTGQFFTANCAAGSANLYLAVKVTNAYVPVSGETLKVRVAAIQAN